jgi:hypothetical protein
MRASTGELSRGGKGMRLTSQLHDLPPGQTAAHGARGTTRNRQSQDWIGSTHTRTPRAPLPHPRDMTTHPAGQRSPCECGLAQTCRAEAPQERRRMFEIEDDTKRMGRRLQRPTPYSLLPAPCERSELQAGFLNFRMNWLVWRRTEASNTVFVPSSAGLARTVLSPTYWKPAASTSAFTFSLSMR